jgi:hypothetical protein
MKYFIAILCCFLLLVLYVIIGVSLRWKHGGGAIPQICVYTGMFLIFRHITKKRKN